MSTPTKAPIEMPTPDITVTSNPCPTSAHMPTPTLTPTSVPMDMFTSTPSPTSASMGTSTPTLAPTGAPTDTSTPTSSPISAPMGTFTLMLTPTSSPMGMPAPTTTPASVPTGTFTLTLTPTSTPMDLPTPTPAPTSAPVGMAKPKPLASRTTLPWSQVSESLVNAWGSDEQFTDESSHLFSLYLAYADKHDKERAESWIAGADGILVFTGLFAAALATFLVDSYKSLLPDSGSNAVAVLTHISQQIANGSQISAQAASVPPFQKFQSPTSAIWINTLWFLSLVTTLFCALLATLQQYWARRYLRITQTQCAIHKRARLRAFFAEGVERFQLPFVVETIPTLIHISMFLFFTGLIISLFSIHHTIARIILGATLVFGFVYTVITVMPVFYHNSPYQSPLSAVIWVIPRKMARIVLSAVSHIVSLQKHTGIIQADSITTLTKKISDCKDRLSWSMAKVAEKAAEVQDWSIDARALSWTLDQSDEESELEKFVAGIARFTQSVNVKNPMELLKKAISGSHLRRSLYRDVTNLLIHVMDPGLLRGSKPLPGSVKQRRIEMFSEALFFIPENIEKILRRLSEHLKDKHEDKKVWRAFASVLESELIWGKALEFSKLWVRYRGNNKTLESVIVGARCMATVMATRLPLADTRSILKKPLGITNPVVLERYLNSRHSFLLKNLNHFLDKTALEFIHLEDTDILISTVRIVIQDLQLNSAAPELCAEFRQHYESIRNKLYKGESDAAWKNAKQLLSELDSLLTPATGNGSAPAPTAQISSPIATPNNATASAMQFPSPSASSPPPGHVYISMPSETPSGETHPLMPMPMPMPSNQAYPEPPPSATLPTMPVPSRDTSSGDEESV